MSLNNPLTPLLVDPLADDECNYELRTILGLGDYGKVTILHNTVTSQ
jgi:hypothetical protein